MKIAWRVARLERTSHPVMKKCPACGDIDPATGEGRFFPGIMLDQSDGTTCCLCKMCGRSFRARLALVDDGLWATEAVLAEVPV